jgi:hypothetical protein
LEGRGAQGTGPIKGETLNATEDQRGVFLGDGRAGVSHHHCALGCEYRRGRNVRVRSAPAVIQNSAPYITGAFSEFSSQRPFSRPCAGREAATSYSG